MTVTRENLNPCTIKLSIVCTPEQVAKGFEKAYKGYAKQLKVPGFRPGHAPKAMVKDMVNPEAIAEAAAEEIVRSSLSAALAQEKLRPHDSPAVELNKIDEAEGTCEYTAKVPLPPVVELGAYKELEIRRPKLDVTDQEVEEQLEDLRKRHGKREAVTHRGIETGDLVVANLRVEGEVGEGRNFMTKVGDTFKALDEAMIGMQVEDIKILDLKFPDTFQEKDWAGKECKTQLTIRTVSSMSMPDLDDQFARELGSKDLNSESLTDLKAKLKERITQAKEMVAQEYAQEAIQEAILAASKVEVPDTMWEAVANQRLREEGQKASKVNKSLEDVAKEAGMELEEYVQKWKDEAKLQVKRAVVANTIFKEEKMRLTNADYNATLLMMAQEYGVHPQTLLDALKKNKGLYEVEVRATYRKVMDFLIQSAKIEEV